MKGSESFGLKAKITGRTIAAGNTGGVERTAPNSCQTNHMFSLVDKLRYYQFNRPRNIWNNRYESSYSFSNSVNSR